MSESKDYKLKMVELAQKIKESCDKNPNYFPLNDIRAFVENIPRPEITVTLSQSEITLYCTDPDALGSVILKDNRYRVSDYVQYSTVMKYMSVVSTMSLTDFSNIVNCQM